MNERLPDSSGLPLRAMVMVLLFLGVVFLLVGFQAMGSGGDSDGEESVATAITSALTPKMTCIFAWSRQVFSVAGILRQTD